MSKLKDLTGQKFGSLTVIGRDESSGDRISNYCRNREYETVSS